MKIDHENIHPDGSAFTASVYVRGVLYIVSYVNHKLLVKLAPYKQPRRALAGIWKASRRGLKSDSPNSRKLSSSVTPNCTARNRCDMIPA